MVQKILVSACLYGSPVRYDGSGAASVSDWLKRWEAEGRLITFCPEVAGGLGVPRPPAEIVGGTGEDVLDGKAMVVTDAGDDVTAAFLGGAKALLDLALRHDVRVAVLKERSPSCGSSGIYDGTFSRHQRDGNGVSAALLLRHGIVVFGESELEQADAELSRST